MKLIALGNTARAAKDEAIPNGISELSVQPVCNHDTARPH